MDPQEEMEKHNITIPYVTGKLRRLMIRLQKTKTSPDPYDTALRSCMQSLSNLSC